MARSLEWQIATVQAIKVENPRVKTFTLALPGWLPHRAGQHYDLRLTAPDGYQAQRSYSIASEPERAGEIDLTVELVPDGEVSTFMHEVVVVGDQLELRGPIGGYFIWEATLGGPLLLVGGGSGVVPLMAMIRHRASSGSQTPARLLYSSRAPEDVIYAQELERFGRPGSGMEVFHTFTRAQPAGWKGYSRRLDQAMVDEVAGPLGKDVRCYVCGPTLMVETAAGLLTHLGLDQAQIRTERFGPTGGSS